MRPIRAVRASAAALALVAGAGAPALARDAGDTVEVTPGAVRPGSPLTLVLRGCREAGAEGHSAAFEETARFVPAGARATRGRRGPVAPGRQTAAVRVRWDATPGDYQITAACPEDERVAEGGFTVLGRHRSTGRAAIAPRPTAAALAVAAVLTATGALCWSLLSPRRRGRAPGRG
jgi:hypothetical protein